MASAYLAIKKQQSPRAALICARHNLREIKAELDGDGNIRPERSSLNVVLAGPDTAAAVQELANDALRDAGISKLRKNQVTLLEIVISLPLEHQHIARAFFADAVAWAGGFLGAPIISAVLHLDEGAPHAHVLVLPLVDGRLRGSDLVGNHVRLRLIQSDFHDKVASNYGLVRAQNVEPGKKRKAAEKAVEALTCTPALLSNPQVRHQLIELITRSPEALLQAIGITSEVRSFVEVMTQRVESV